MARGGTDQSLKSTSQINSETSLSSSLPPRWNDMSDSDRAGILHQLLVNNLKCIQDIFAEQKFIRARLAEHVERFLNIETVISQQSNEIMHSKQLLVHDNDNSELKFIGIPSSSTDTIDNLAELAEKLL